MVTFDEPVADQKEARAASLAQATVAIATATDRGWATPDEARRLWWRLAGEADEVEGRGASSGEVQKGAR